MLPGEIRTEHLLLRGWQESDAELLLPVLESNVAHLEDWIPAHVASVVPLPELRIRLATFAADFRASRYWRFGIFSLDQREVFGEVDLFFRSPLERRPLASADRAEIGYWLRSDMTGRGYATEAARAMMTLAQTLPEMKRVEIRCNALNTASAAVPGRLGFVLAEPDESKPANESSTLNQMLWTYEL